jgi:hypothetical protein
VSTPFMAEEFALQQSQENSSAVQLDERACPAPAVGVNRPANEFLARPLSPLLSKRLSLWGQPFAPETSSKAGLEPTIP